MVCGGVVEYDAAARTYGFPPEHAVALTGASAKNLATVAEIFPLLSRVIPDVVEAFRTGRGVPYRAYQPDFTGLMDRRSRPRYDEHLFGTYLALPEGLIPRANERQIPVLRTPQDTTPFIHQLTAFLDYVFAPSVTAHASLVDVYGVGLLFTGRSGIGKSETALDLVERGHRLVADDVVRITRRHGDILIGAGNEVLKHTMEVRGLGIIDVQAIFGIRSIRGQKRVEVEVHLTEWNDARDYERVGLDDQMAPYLDVQIPLITIPIFPGKNITVIAEVVALNHLVKVYGYHPARALNDRLMESMRMKLLSNPLVRDDTE